jgi:hypothetical protein
MSFVSKSYFNNMRKKIRIGIDFDNTIVNYDNLFKKAALHTKWSDKDSLGETKATIKSTLFSVDGNDLRWQELQAILYGILIKEARPFSGVVETLKYFSLDKNIELFIVSHKTKYSSFSKDITFIDKAVLWLAENKISEFVSEKNTYFAPDRDEKIKIIASLNLNYFIDDLIEVLEDKNFPDIKRILFTNENVVPVNSGIVILNSWEKIKEKIYED